MGEKLIERKRETYRKHFYISPDLFEQIESNLPLGKCKSKSEYVCKAVEFYNFFLHNQSDADLLCKYVNDIVSAIIKNTENRLARMDFKIAVELAKVSHMIARLCEIDKTQLDRLHNICQEEVSRINGVIQFDKAVNETREREQ